MALSDKVVAEIENQRKKLALDIIKENYHNSVNRDILYICQNDFQRGNPFKNFKFEKFREKIKSQTAVMKRNRHLSELAERKSELRRSQQNQY